MADPYAVLEVSPTATDAEIKAAYRRLVKQHHPDAGGDDQRMLALNAAWEVLGDAERRRAHDRSRGARGRTTTAPDLRRAAAEHNKAVEEAAEAAEPIRVEGAVDVDVEAEAMAMGRAVSMAEDSV